MSLCRVDLTHDRLELFWLNKHREPYREFVALQQSLRAKDQNLIFAMNAGMYLTDYSPLGLFVSDHHEHPHLNVRTGKGNFYAQPNGVFMVDDQGAHIVTTAEYRAGSFKPRLATQSGPILVQHGQLTHSAVMSPTSTSDRIRNGVCVLSSHHVVFVISDAPVTFHQFGRYFLKNLQCRDALFFDGTVSSLYAPSLKRADNSTELGPMIGVVR